MDLVRYSAGAPDQPIVLLQGCTSGIWLVIPVCVCGVVCGHSCALPSQVTPNHSETKEVHSPCRLGDPKEGKWHQNGYIIPAFSLHGEEVARWPEGLKEVAPSCVRRALRLGIGGSLGYLSQES